MRSQTLNRPGLMVRSAGSPCRMEGLEPRLLLANELVIGIDNVNFRDPQLPDDKIEVPVTIQNLSAAQISGKIRIQIWASLDGVLDDPGDFLCFEGNLSINPRANEIQIKKVKAKLPLDILNDDYFFIVSVIEEMLPGDASFDVTESLDDEEFRVRWVFGSVDGRSGNTTLKFMNTSGVIYKINFSEGFDDDGEIGEVFSSVVLNRDERGTPGPDGQFIDLVFDNTEFDDRISVRRTGGPSDPDLFYLTSIFADSEFLRGGGGDDLGFFDASNLTLYGVADFAGLHKLFLGNVLDAEEVDIDNNVFARGEMNGSFDDRVSIKVKDVVGTLFSIQGTLANMQALSFSGEISDLRGGGFGGIEADIIEKVNIKNDFEGSVDVSGFPSLRGSSVEDNRVIDAFIVGGELSGVFFARGGVAKIQAGSINIFEAAIQGRLERLIVKGDVGVDPTLRGTGSINIIGATDISRVDIDGSLFDTQLFAGLDFTGNLRGSGGFQFGDLYGGDISSAVFTSGMIGRVNIGGGMFFSEIAAGVDPNGEPFFATSDAYLIGDSSVSFIGPIKVGGVVVGSFFVSGDFPDNASIDGSSYDTMADPDDIFIHVFPPI